ncbi:CPBP family intramembrane metalloprotease [Verrucomicrobia bacterium S94]|nr:CPBP family intramembrane metalloprotease [Verrucomicrobia bacterium S94]
MKIVPALIPYLAVLLGMHVLSSAWAAMLFYHAGMLLFLCIRKSSGDWKKIGRGCSPLLIPAMIVCALAAPVVYFMWPFFRISEHALVEWMAEYGLTGAAWMLLIPWFSVVHPMLEELHWRGIGPERAERLCWQDFAFAGYHVFVLYELVYWPWLFMVFGILVGSSFFWRWAAERFGGYLLPVLTHAVADAGVLMGVWLLIRR